MTAKKNPIKHHEMSNKPLHCLHEFGTPGHPKDTPKVGAMENW